MAKVTFIGDVHGMIEQYKKLLLRFTEPTIQLGDMGIGFRGKNSLPLTMGEMDPKDRWFHGNHDNPQDCLKEPGYLGRFGVTPEEVFYLSGAFSVDAFYRTIGVDWWADEQLSRAEFDEALKLYSDIKPVVVATHDCPRSVYPLMIQRRFGHQNAPLYENTTSHFLESLLNIHQPRIWIFGHWHRSFDEEVGNTRFVCLDELQPLTVEW